MWEDNIKMDLSEWNVVYVVWVGVAQDGNIECSNEPLVPFWLASEVLASQKGLSSMNLGINSLKHGTKTWCFSKHSIWMLKKCQSGNRQAGVYEIWMEQCVLKFVEMCFLAVSANSINAHYVKI